MAWNAWKRCCKKVDFQGEHFAGIHDRFPRDTLCSQSQLAIGWSEQSAKSRMNFRKKTIHTNSLHRKEEDSKDNVSYPEQSRQKWAYETSIWFSSRCLNEKSSTTRIRWTNWRAYPSRTIRSTASLFIKHIVVGQVWMELEMSCSTRQNLRTERVPCSPQRVEEMPQKSWFSRGTLQRYSRSLLWDPSLSWIATQNWLDRAVRTSWHSKITRTVSPKRNSKDSKESGISHSISRAKTRKNRLRRESGEEVAEPTSPKQFRRWQSSSGDQALLFSWHPRI